MRKMVALMLCLMLMVACVPSLAESTTFRTLYGSEVSTLNYLITSTTWDMTTGANTVDTLIEYDTAGNIVPALAESWEVSEDELTWTFHLRDGQKWYDYAGNEVADVTAQDFVDALKYVLTAEYDSSVEYMVDAANIVNGDAYFNGDVTDFAEVGVKAEDALTLVFTLAQPTPYFLSCLTYGCFLPAYGPLLEELGADFATSNEKMYFNGAYLMSEYEPQGRHVYVKNPNYWDAEHVYIERIEQRYNSESATTAPLLAQRGEVDSAGLSTDILDEWKATNPDIITRSRMHTDYSYFYAFNFDPQYDAEYGPENWLIAVNNENFRHSIMSALNRDYIMRAEEPDDPASIMQNAVTPATFTSVDGTDFTKLAAFDEIEDNYFNEEKALEYKAKAMEELTAAGATFPVKMLVTYRSDDTDWENQTILLEQQMEGLLGADYVDIIPYAGPSDSFLSKTRRAGMYSFMRCNYGADYEDPQTWTDPFAERIDRESGLHTGNTYNKMDKMLDADFAETKALMTDYYAKVAEAKAISDSTASRYQAFAEAEALLINHAIVVPFRVSVRDYQVTKLNVFEAAYAPCGVCALRYKGQKVYDDFFTAEAYAEAEKAWLEATGN